MARRHTIARRRSPAAGRTTIEPDDVACARAMTGQTCHTGSGRYPRSRWIPAFAGMTGAWEGIAFSPAVDAGQGEPMALRRFDPYRSAFCQARNTMSDPQSPIDDMGLTGK